MNFHKFKKKRVSPHAFLQKAFYLNGQRFADEWLKVFSIDESIERFMVKTLNLNLKPFI
jgi:hypothetical protein